VSEGFPLPSWAPRLGACGQFHSLATHWPSSLGQSSTLVHSHFLHAIHLTISQSRPANGAANPAEYPGFFPPGDRLSARADHQNLLWWPPTAPKRRGDIQCECRRFPKRILSGVRELPVSSLLHSTVQGVAVEGLDSWKVRMFAMDGPSTSTAIRLKGIVRKYLEHDAIICWPFPPTNQPLCISLWQPY
jgi:hypothetical protein